VEQAAFPMSLEESLVSRLLLRSTERYPALLASANSGNLAQVPQHYIAYFLGVSLSRSPIRQGHARLAYLSASLVSKLVIGSGRLRKAQLLGQSSAQDHEQRLT
jgi:hypothetical protein